MKHIIITKIDFVQPYKVEMLPSLSLNAVADIRWTFSNLEDALEVAQTLKDEHNARFAVFGDEIVAEFEALRKTICRYGDCSRKATRACEDGSIVCEEHAARKDPYICQTQPL